MSTDTQNQIASQVSAAIAQQAASKGQAVLSALGNTQSEASTNISTIIHNNISNVTQNDVSAAMSQNQALTLANIGGNVVIADVTMTQSAELVASALMSTSAYAIAINDSATKMDQSSSSTEENPIAAIIKSIGSAISSLFAGPILITGAVVVGIIGAIIIIILIVKWIRSK